MMYLLHTFIMLISTLAYCQVQAPFPDFSGDPFQLYHLSAPGINASFIPYGRSAMHLFSYSEITLRLLDTGARLTSLCVADRNGVSQDVVLGYDSAQQYLNDSDTVHTYLWVQPSFVSSAVARRYGY